MIRIASIARQRLLSLALIALLVQASLPYLLTNCPVYAVGGAAVVVSHAMPADCPMLGMHQPASIDKTAPQPAKQTADYTCPLCTVMSPLHGFIVAGLIALPPPSRLVSVIDFISPQARTSRLPQTASFSARAPPVTG